MTKVMKWLGGSVAGVIGGVALLGASGTFNATDVAAQSPPAPPARFAGSVLVDGQQPPSGTVIEARVGGVSCGVDATFVASGEMRYAIDVEAEEPDGRDCGTEGATVTFLVGGMVANESGTWLNFDINLVDLTVTSPTATPQPSTATPVTATPMTATPTTGTGTATVTSTSTTGPGTPTVTPTKGTGGSVSTPTRGTGGGGGTAATPRPPATGSGTEAGDSSAVWLFALLGAGALAFGAGGAAVARRGK